MPDLKGIVVARKTKASFIILPTAMATTGPTFFSEMKKGEVNELRAQLRGAASERDTLKLRSTVQKVIAYMTLGIDVSALFSEMIMVRREWHGVLLVTNTW